MQGELRKEAIITKARIKFLVCLFALTFALLIPHTDASAATKTYYVNVSSGYLNVRNKPTLSGSTVVATLKHGQSVKVIGTVNHEWAAFRLNGKVRYASLQYLTTKKSSSSSSSTSTGFPAKYVVSNSYGYLNIRNKPNLTTSKVVATVKQGKKLTALYQVNSEWMAIKYKNKVRYVYAAYIRRK